MNKKNRTGFWFLIGFGILLNIIYLLGQTMALINYEFTVAIGLQEPVSEISEVGMAMNKGFGMGDTLFYMPLFIIGIAGLIKRSAWGMFAMLGAMAVTVYWPFVCLSTLFFARGAEGFFFTDYASYSILLSIIAIYGLWGFCFIYKNRKSLIREL